MCYDLLSDISNVGSISIINNILDFLIFVCQSLWETDAYRCSCWHITVCVTHLMYRNSWKCQRQIYISDKICVLVCIHNVLEHNVFSNAMNNKDELLEIYYGYCALKARRCLYYCIYIGFLKVLQFLPLPKNIVGWLAMLKKCFHVWIYEHGALWCTGVLSRLYSCPAFPG